MSEVVYTSRSHIERKSGPLRIAHLPGEPQPVAYSVHGAIAEHYKVDPAKLKESGDEYLLEEAMYDFRGEAYVLQQARYDPSESESNSSKVCGSRPVTASPFSSGLRVRRNKD